MLADLHGRPRKDKPPPNEPKPVTGDLADPPDYLSEQQRTGWRYAIEHAPPGLLKRIDRGMLTVWIVAEDLHRQAVRAQNQLGALMMKSPVQAVPMPSFYLSVIRQQALVMIRAASELGFSPVSRPRVGIMPSLPIPAPVQPANDRSKAPEKRSLDQFLASHPETRH